MDHNNHQPNPHAHFFPPGYHFPTHHDYSNVMTTPTAPTQQPYYYPPHFEGMMTNNIWSQEQEKKRIMDAISTKIARSKRKLARQKSKASSSSAAAASSSVGSNLLNTQADRQRIIEREKALLQFITPENKRLRLLLKKVLKKSDVSSLGRIVLPKRETEENLPTLYEKEGIKLAVRDIYSTKEWVFKFKFWANNKSRMYLLENTGEFSKHYGLENGDCLSLYEDDCKNLYYTVQKATKETQASEETMDENNKYYYTNREEEDASLAILIEQLKHREPNEVEAAQNLLGHPPSSSNGQNYGFYYNYGPYGYDQQYQATTRNNL
ncbi:B3 domain-containing transcription factor LEC2 [Linum perenne]